MPGQIGINLKGRFDPLGTADVILQGDTKASHVWLVLPNGKIATTGAKWLVLYGEVDPDEYLKGKSCYLLETVDPLTSQQLAIIQYAHNSLMKSGPGRIYGLWKFGVIWALDFFQGQASKTGFTEKTGHPTCPICSQAVGYALWKAGVPVGKSVGKEDYTAVLPETFLQEAQQTAYDLAKGYMENRTTPCYLLKTVQDSPFSF